MNFSNRVAAARDQLCGSIFNDFQTLVFRFMEGRAGGLKNGMPSAYQAGRKPVMVPDLWQSDEETRQIIAAKYDSLEQAECALENGELQEERKMPFTEICIYQVKPQKTEEFETLMQEARSFLEKQEGLLLLRLAKREYRIDMEQIKEGQAPLKITRIVKSVKYMLYWEFDTKESYGAAQKKLYESYWKSIEKCLIVPHDKYLGEVLF